MDILARARPLEALESVELLDSLGRVLARDVFSDVDLPPFQKSAMDGFAVHSADFEGLPEDSGDGADVPATALKVLGESRAGVPYGRAVEAGTCVAIYTGAEVPEGCDAVVMVEKSTREGANVHLRDRPREGQNVCNRGEDLASGARALAAPRRLGAADLSVLAAVGCTPVPVFRRPRVSILTTGDELVGVDERPGPGQIREGNTLHLAALALSAGADVREVARVPDQPDVLRERFGAALEHSDVVITTGGVSAGKYDLVAEAFQDLGVEEVFHKVAIKPGKPIWFGTRGDTLVFGLPGNPVSCLVTQEVFVRGAIAKLGGAPPEEWAERLRRGRWCGPDLGPHPRQRNLPVTIEQAADGVDDLHRVRWSSSADIVGLTAAAGMVVIPAGEGLSAGAIASFRPLGHSSFHTAGA